MIPERIIFVSRGITVFVSFICHPFKLLVGLISQDSQPPCLNHVTSEYEGVPATNWWPSGLYCSNFSLSCLWISYVNHYFIFVKKQMTSAVFETLCCVCEYWCLDSFFVGWLTGWVTDRQVCSVRTWWPASDVGQLFLHSPVACVWSLSKTPVSGKEAFPKLL